jgi:hypothetical protein
VSRRIRCGLVQFKNDKSKYAPANAVKGNGGKASANDRGSGPNRRQVPEYQ